MIYKYGYGLSGGIASGKSTVCKMLKKAGLPIIDADIIAKEQFEICSEEIIKTFGNKVLKEGRLDRKKVGQLVFADSKARKSLEKILHPKIRQEIYEAALDFEKKEKIYIMDIPLLFESGEYPCKERVLVYVPKTIQLERLMQRDNISKEDALKRIDAQIDIEEKKRMSDWVIDNSKERTQLEDEVERFLKHIQGDRCK